MSAYGTRKIVAEHLRNLAKEGATVNDAIKQTGLGRSSLHRYSKDFGFRFAPACPPKPAKERGPRVGFTFRPPDPKAVFVEAGTIRQSCILNHGKMSAAQLAQMIGCTRNVVIGHWFRARQRGLIT